MTSTFLHEDKNVPPDEAEEREAPKCPVCGHQMWMTRLDTQLPDGGTQSGANMSAASAARSSPGNQI